MARERLQCPRTPRRSQRIKPFCDRASVPGTDREHSAVRNRNFALKKRTRTEPVPPVLAPKSGSPADSSGHKSENVNDGKQRLRRTAAAAATAQGLEKTVNGPSSATNKSTGNRRNKSVSAVKDWKKAQKPSSPNYFINTRSTRRSEIVISYSNSASSYYNQLCNEDLVIPTKPTLRNTNNSRKSNESGTNNNKLTERYKKVARRTSKRLSRSSASTRKRVLFENILAYEYKDTVENSTSEEEAEVEEEAEQVVPLVPRKSFFESSVEDFCQLHPAFEKATERCLNRLRLVRSAFSMNSPASPSTPAPTMTAVSSTAIYQSHLSPNTAALIAQSQQITTHSGKRKHPEDTYTIPTNDHNYQQVQSTTPPGHNTQQQHPNKQLVHPNSSNQTNHFRLSPRSWIYQTPDKQKLGKLPPPSTIRDEDDETLTVPVMIHHNKRLKTVYSFDESTVADIVGAGGGGSEVQIDSDRLAPICQITTADDGADCEFEANNSIDDDVTLTSNSTNGTSTTIGRCEEQNQFQVQTHELSLDFGTSTVVGKQQRLVGGGGDGEVAFLDQWVRMNSGGSGSGSSSGDHSPLRLLQTNQHHIPQTMVPSRYFAQPPLAQAHVNHHLRNIHNVATQRPTKSLPRCDRRQYLERKSLTFEEMNSGTSDTPKANGIRAMISGKLRALKQKAASADSISDGGVTGSGGGRKSMNLFHVGRGEIMRDLRDIAETVTSGAYERELSNEQENILPPSHMGLLLGNLQMNDSVDIRYDRPLFPRRNY